MKQTMLATRSWFLSFTVVLGAFGLALWGCAPTPTPPPSKPTGPPTTDPTTEVVQLQVEPKPLDNSLKVRIEEAVRNVREREMQTTNGFWTIFHGILGLGPSLPLRDSMTNEKIIALDYICNGGKLRGLQFELTEHGLNVITTGDMIGQGHQDQFVAEMGQWNIAPDRRFRFAGRDFKYMDFVKHSQMRASIKGNQELSWAICLIPQYISTEAAWTNEQGEQLRLEDLLRYELNLPMESAACGGTHRLFGLAWAYHLHMERGGKEDKIWQDIAANTAKYRDLAKKFQNPDGSFSTLFYYGNGKEPAKNINATGHMVEWLALAFSDDELREPWVQQAVNALCMMILDNYNKEIDGGSLYHAVHGLLMYYARVYDRTTLGPAEIYIPPHPQTVRKNREK